MYNVIITKKRIGNVNTEN